MKFAIFSLLPLLASASAIGEREVSVMNTEPTTVDVKDLPAGAELNVVELKTSGQFGLMAAAASCPPGYPKYCPRYGFCCPAQAQACCPRACCGHRNAVCGTDGLCYIIRK